MTRNLFTEWLGKFDRDMQRQGRHVLLVLNWCLNVERLLIPDDRPAANLPHRVSLYSAVEMVKAAWAEVTAACVWNCFRKAGFVDVVSDGEPGTFEEDQSGGDLWQRIVDFDMGGHDIGWGGFISADEDTDIAEPCTDEASFMNPRPSQEEQASPGKHERSARQDTGGIPEQATRSRRREVPLKRLNL
ncbi:hypothetical protein HPB49_007957 [Dermacentor silvarum]|uniref:Uncharacterized protein n=1 Tax=Dermacentor silvarum TaxID=543639 RepID=A0ACB8DXD9_DERSI|nr:hypothetical protein HPB49_007957 [Dermacentor silvarum]